MTWVPAVHEPLCRWFGIRCPCGRWFLRDTRFREHYSHVHVLGRQ